MIPESIRMLPAQFIVMATVATLISLLSFAIGLVLLRGTVMILPWVNYRRASLMQLFNVEEYTLYTTIFQCLAHKGIAYEEKCGQIVLSERDMLIKVRSSEGGAASVEVSAIPGKTGNPQLLYELRPELESLLSHTPYPKFSSCSILPLFIGVTSFIVAAVGWYVYFFAIPRMYAAFQ